jgi:hypothetical protein
MEEFMLRRNRIVLAYCKAKEWGQINKLSMEQVMEIRKLVCWKESPSRLDETVLTAPEILRKMIARGDGLYSNTAEKYVMDLVKADQFVKEYFMQILTNRDSCIANMGEELVRDVELYFQTRG